MSSAKKTYLPLVLPFAGSAMWQRTSQRTSETEEKGFSLLEVIIALAIFGLLAAAIAGTSVRTTERQGVEFETLGETLFVQWAVPFEVASLVLLVALIGAIVLVRSSGGRD